MTDGSAGHVRNTLSLIDARARWPKAFRERWAQAFLGQIRGQDQALPQKAIKFTTTRQRRSLQSVWRANVSLDEIGSGLPGGCLILDHALSLNGGTLSAAVDDLAPVDADRAAVALSQESSQEEKPGSVSSSRACNARGVSSYTARSTLRGLVALGVRAALGAPPRP